MAAASAWIFLLPVQNQLKVATEVTLMWFLYFPVLDCSSYDFHDLGDIPCSTEM